MAVNGQWCISIEYRDAKGQTRKVTICWFANGAAVGTLQQDYFNATAAAIPLLQALSNAHVQSLDNPTPTAPDQYRGYTWGSTGDYQSVAQQAVLSYTTVDDTNAPQAAICRLTIPAPKASIFLPDLVTVDPANADVIALNAQILAGAVPVTNAAVLSTKSLLIAKTFIGGVFVGRKLTRRFNKFTYNPELTVRGI
jgi:hypothetical protein